MHTALKFPPHYDDSIFFMLFSKMFVGEAFHILKRKTFESILKNIFCLATFKNLYFDVTRPPLFSRGIRNFNVGNMFKRIHVEIINKKEDNRVLLISDLD